MKGSEELLARRKVLAFGVDAFVVINIILEANEDTCINGVHRCFDGRQTNV